MKLQLLPQVERGASADCLQSMLSTFPNATNPPKYELDYYRDAEARSPTATASLVDLIDGIKGQEFAERVARIRELIAAGDKPQADALKKTLAAVSISGCITTGRRKGAADEGRLMHSGLLQIDLDAKDNPTWTVERMVEALHGDPHIQAGFITPSGRGVKGIACIPADAANHKAAFLAAEKYFAAMGLKIDASCKDPVRLCFVSHDPEAWVRAAPATAFEPLQAVEAEPETRSGYHFAPDCSGELHATTAPSFRLSGSGGLLIRGSGIERHELTLGDVRSMLACIPYPGYDSWLKIANAVWQTVGEAGTAILQEWAPEKKPGDYAEKFAHRLSDVNTGTLVMIARDHGWAPPPPVSAVAPLKAAEGDSLPGQVVIPASVFPVPANEIGIEAASSHIFSIIAPTWRLFVRGRDIFELVRDAAGERLEPLTSDGLCPLLETFGPRVARFEKSNEGKVVWRSAVFPESAARKFLKSPAARERLPAIRQLLACPIITPGGEILGAGFHSHAGGTLVLSSTTATPPPLSLAVQGILDVLQDFEFPTDGDAARAAASIISPALKMGGWINEDFPLDLAEADQSQSGKTYRQKLVCAIYKETPATITPTKGGVGSLDEAISTVMMRGRTFINLGNFRGKLDSPIMEEAIRGSGFVQCRGLHRAATVDTSAFLWQLSTNGAELTRDAANRSIITRIRKRPDNHVFQIYPEGDLLAHVKARQPFFLGCVFAVIEEWNRQGCQRTNEARHDFRGWCQSLDWIVQKILGLGPLLDGHREVQMRTANPAMQWLREIINATMLSGYQGAAMAAADIAELSEEHDIAIPGKGNSTSADMRVGSILGRLYRESEGKPLRVDGHLFVRHLEADYDPINRKHRERKAYTIETLVNQ